MKGEIRGLKAGIYWSDDESCFMKIAKNDLGVCVEVVDLDADIFYAFTVDENKEAKFEWGDTKPQM